MALAVLGEEGLLVSYECLPCRVTSILSRFFSVLLFFPIKQGFE